MIIIEWILLIFLIVCAIAVSISRSLLNSVIIFMSYSLVMAVIWILLQAPDLAITEAAVGAGVTSTLFYLALKRIGRQQEAAKTSPYPPLKGEAKSPPLGEMSTQSTERA